jgi:hypothetical protein
MKLGLTGRAALRCGTASEGLERDVFRFDALCALSARCITSDLILAPFHLGKGERFHG